jgi:hypothetical protein
MLACLDTLQDRYFHSNFPSSLHGFFATGYESNGTGLFWRAGRRPANGHGRLHARRALSVEISFSRNSGSETWQVTGAAFVEMIVVRTLDS